MTFNQMTRNIARNASLFIAEGEVAKAQACIDLLAIVRDRDFQSIRGQVDLSMSPAE